MAMNIDLHSHSHGSPDGSLVATDYKAALASGLDFIAITDHDSIDAAQKIRKQLGPKIIIGQEVTTTDGEIIGLFLSKKVEPKLSAKETAVAIKQQGGLVYIPHPFETVRKGLPKTVLDDISVLVDIVEVFNGRALFQNKGPQAATWARLHGKQVAASSDAHGKKGLGSCYTTIAKTPDAKNLVKQLEVGRLVTNRPPFSSLLYPKLNRLRGKIPRKT